jgi:L-ascorbate metabolism protein UlaG (beta-lactamase superfamily)
MKVTKYPQSCLIIEEDGRRLCIDPGSVVTGENFTAQDLLPLDAILITHEHADHADENLLRDLTSSGSIPVVANERTKNVFNNLVTKTVADGEQFEAAGFHITARELPHVAMMDGQPGPQNTGYVLNDVFFHPGDGIKIDNLHVDKAAVPLAGPDLSARDAFDFIKQIGASTVIPIHYDVFPANPQMLADVAQNLLPDVKFLVISDAESTEI